MKFIIQAKLQIEVEADTKENAQTQAETVLAGIEKEKVVKISEARIVDMKTGYFIS